MTCQWRMEQECLHGIIIADEDELTMNDCRIRRTLSPIGGKCTLASTICCAKAALAVGAFDPQND